MFFHQGRAVPEPVRINVIEPAGERAVAFDPALFDYGKNKFEPQTLRGLGFNGFRVHYAINKPGYKDEVARLPGRELLPRRSARARATACRRAAWRSTPPPPRARSSRASSSSGSSGRAPTPTSLTIYALLDSRRVAGAYRFVLTPGVETTMQVTARLYLREKIGKLGIAPLTSMFTFGENQPGRDDYRPEVHDSDGLSIQLARRRMDLAPARQSRAACSSRRSAPTNPRGFGLMQRDRSSTSYEDPEALYERRPSAWVEPIGNWGAGRVELVQIPTPDETNDNIVAFWVPQVAARRRASRSTSPTGSAGRAAGTVPAGKGWVVQTRRGRGFARQAGRRHQLRRRFRRPGAALAGRRRPTSSR